MAEVSKFKLGLFVLGALGLMVVVLFLLGISERFAPKGKLVTFFTESVQGLDVGSPVKYKGVPIGRVSAIFIDTKDKKIRVDMNVDLKTFTVSNQESAMMSLNSFYDFFRNERALGLRCRMDYGGLTGLKYIELDYFAQPSPGVARIVMPDEAVPGRLLVPSTPSTLTDIMGKLNRSLEKIASVDFEGISQRLMTSLGDASAVLGDENLKESLKRIGSITENLDKVSAGMAASITEDSLNRLVGDLKHTLSQIDGLSNSLAKQVDDAKLGETGVSIRNSAIAFDDFQRQLLLTAGKLNGALDSLTALIEYLSDDPSALLTGKKRRPISR